MAEGAAALGRGGGQAAVRRQRCNRGHGLQQRAVFAACLARIAPAVAIVRSGLLAANARVGRRGRGSWAATWGAALAVAVSNALIGAVRGLMNVIGSVRRGRLKMPCDAVRPFDERRSMPSIVCHSPL